MQKLMTFENSFVLTLFALFITGTHPGITRTKIWAVYLVSIMALKILCIALLVNSIISYDISDGKIAEACKNGAMVALGAIIIIKYLVLLVNKNQIQIIINLINEDYETAKNLPLEEKYIIEDYSNRGIFVTKLWVFTTMMTTGLFLVIAIFKMFYLYWNDAKEFAFVPMFDIHYPDFVNRYKKYLPFFISTFLLCLWYAVYCSIMLIGFEPLGPIFMLHFCGQCELIRSRILRLFSDDDTDIEILRRKLVDVIKLSQRIYSAVLVNEKCFMIVYEVSMKASTIAIPTASFQILESLHNGYLNIEFMSFLYACFIHCYVPCYYSNVLMEKGEAVRQAIYACGWEKMMDKPIRKMLIIMLMQANRSLAVRSVFTVLNLDSFAEMCRQAYAIFNLMNAAFN